MKKILLLIVVVTCLIGCESSSIRDGRKAYKEYFKETLKDPESLKIYKEEIIYRGELDAKFKVEIGAKNSYGAYVRETYCFHTLGNKIIASGDFMLFNENPKAEPRPNVPDMFSKYQKFFPLTISPLVPSFSIGVIITTKNPNLGCDSAVDYICMIDDIEKSDKNSFNNSCSTRSIKLIPANTKLKIVTIEDNYIKVLVSDGELKGSELFVSKFIE